MAVRKFLKYLLPEIAPTERNRKKPDSWDCPFFLCRSGFEIGIALSRAGVPTGGDRERGMVPVSVRYGRKGREAIGPAVRIAFVRFRDHKVFAVRRRNASVTRSVRRGMRRLLSDDHFRRSASKAVWRSACVPDSVRRSDASARPVRLRAATDRPASREAPR